MFGSSKARVGVEVGLVLVRLVVSVVTGDTAVELGVCVIDLLVCAVDQKPRPSEVGWAERPRDLQILC